MTEDIYKQLCETMKNRGGMYPGKDIPEFYELAQVLFTPEECRLLPWPCPEDSHTAGDIAGYWEEAKRRRNPYLKRWLAKGSVCQEGKEKPLFTQESRLCPAYSEYQFMRGTVTDTDRKLARLIRDYKAAVDRERPAVQEPFPVMRVITVNRTVKAENHIHTYDQVKSYIDTYAPLAVSTCYCRHQARLIDESLHCGNPDDVCLQFGRGAQFCH